jgi:hypothetical protein
MHNTMHSLRTAKKGKKQISKNPNRDAAEKTELAATVTISWTRNGRARTVLLKEMSGPTAKAA